MNRSEAASDTAGEQTVWASNKH